jgi:hypothetical protein
MYPLGGVGGREEGRSHSWGQTYHLSTYCPRPGGHLCTEPRRLPTPAEGKATSLHTVLAQEATSAQNLANYLHQLKVLDWCHLATFCPRPGGHLRPEPRRLPAPAKGIRTSLQTVLAQEATSAQNLGDYLHQLKVRPPLYILSSLRRPLAPRTSETTCTSWR